MQEKHLWNQGPLPLRLCGEAALSVQTPLWEFWLIKAVYLYIELLPRSASSPLSDLSDCSVFTQL